MAQRFGGQHSPQSNRPAQPLHSAKPRRSGARANLLFFLPLPLALRAFAAEPVVMAQYLAALGSLLLAAWLTREGLKAQEAYEARTIARRPAIPRKIFAATLTGAGLALTGLAGHGPVAAAIFAVLGAGLHLLSFGLDPLRSKGVDEGDDFQAQRVAKLVEEAETALHEIDRNVTRARDRALSDRAASLQAEARRLFRTVETDPCDLAATRKYLTVYLTAARDAADKYADLAQRRPDPEARARFDTLLVDLQDSFRRQTDSLLSDDHIDLQIEIDVLRDRLAREGVRLPNTEG
jgi:hypothetical protein